MDITRLNNRLSRSISPENPTGEKGKGGMCPLDKGGAQWAAREMGRGWKVNPFVDIAPHTAITLADIDGSGAIAHIWMTIKDDHWRCAILRFYWEGQEKPAVEAPVADFFCMGWNKAGLLSSRVVCVNAANGFNAYWEMPFRKRCRITLENVDDIGMRVFYQIDYALFEQPEDIVYFHAQFRRVNPLPDGAVYTIVDNVRGRGHYVGTYLAWGSNSNGWWGEGEVKFYIDGDKEYPTICSTGTEDYFCGAYSFLNPKTKAAYQTYCTPYAGFHQALLPDQLYASQCRFGAYRWHLPDPVFFSEDLRVTIQALGWRSGHRYLPLRDDIASVAYWYQQLPSPDFPLFPGKDSLEVI